VADTLSRFPSEYLLKESPQAGTTFRELRNALLDAGPLDRKTCELIVIAGLATGGFEDSFKIHARRLLDMGAPTQALRHAVLVTLGASSVMFQVARALMWIDELEQSG
jgi:alkylhydroperoxidase/carboxymuconolactone decarboxylase family protein YurZ